MSTLLRRDLILGGLAAAAPAMQAAKRPNILYVFSDQHRASAVGAYGDPNVRTPTLDAFSKQGARFDVAISNTPVCCPHRACLQTGLYSNHHGVVSNGVRFTRKARGLAEQFRDAGYVTGYTGKWHIPAGYGTENGNPLGYPPDAVGGLTRGGDGGARAHCTMVNGKELYIPTILADNAVKFIQEKSRGSAPWLYFLSWLPPHSPYIAPPDYRSHYQANLKLQPNVPKGAPEDYTRKVLPDYYGMVESLDAEFKRILDALDRAGVAKDTIVCYSSDHGDMVGGHGYTAKRWPHDESARVPLMIRYPGRIRPGTVIADPFSTVDVYPTLASLAGLKAPTGIDGLDYSDLITGRKSIAPRDYAYLQMMYAYVPWPGWRAIRTREYTYARTGKAPWILYHTAKDPFQTRNLVDDPSSRTLLAEMDRRLAALMKESGDTWEYQATTGDYQQWMPGGAKLEVQQLGVPYPGSDVRGGGRKKRKKKR
ncbi:MAG: sulfatase [Acidobacteria bacterium]|nr:sulfatase [Acidobacteriota bacterium]